MTELLKTGDVYLGNTRLVTTRAGEYLPENKAKGIRVQITRPQATARRRRIISSPEQV